MSDSLIIVESPTKVKTIKKYLGPDFDVRASMGHVKDLPKSTLGIDMQHDFEPTYQVIETKKKIIAELKKAAKSAKNIYLAPDPDREGEAIAWHIADEITAKGKIIRRVLFNDLTKNTILDAISHPLDLNFNKYEAQQTRRILDRLVGYQISPLLWEKVKRGLSAGRVQSVAVRIICDREAEHRGAGRFKPAVIRCASNENRREKGQGCQRSPVIRTRSETEGCTLYRRQGGKERNEALSGAALYHQQTATGSLPEVEFFGKKDNECGTEAL